MSQGSGTCYAARAMRFLLASLTASLIVLLARVVTAVRGVWTGSEPTARRRVYFCNHVSHGDFVLVWTVLPPALRRRTRPVAGADYWDASPLRRFIGRDVFDAVLIDRDRRPDSPDPIDAMATALDRGASLILFPEGTRNTGSETLLPFKSGLYRLGRARPTVDLVPVFIENLNRVMPKGEFVPIPIICTVTFGAPIRVEEGEDKDAFLARARGALLALARPEMESATAPEDGAGDAGASVGVSGRTADTGPAAA